MTDLNPHPMETPPRYFPYAKYQHDPGCPCMVLFFQQKSRLPHTHEFIELVIVLSGSGRHCIGGRRVQIVKGSVFTVFPGEQHWYEDCRELSLANVMFLPSALDFAAGCDWKGAGFGHFFRPSPKTLHTQLSAKQMEEVVPLLERMVSEQTRRMPGHALAIRALFETLVVTLSRIPLGHVAASAHSLQLGKMLRFMHLNFARDITRDDICAAGGCSVRTGNRIFQDQLRSTPVRELIKIRLVEGAHLLSRPHLTVTEIAQRCGFRDSNYFTLCFTRHYGASPRQFRQARL